MTLSEDVESLYTALLQLERQGRVAPVLGDVAERAGMNYERAEAAAKVNVQLGRINGLSGVRRINSI